MARAIGARAKVAAAFESTYGTAPGSGFINYPFASFSLGPDQPLVENELLGYGRDPLAPTLDAVTVDGEAVVPIDAEAFGYWLKAAFGAPATTDNGDGTFDHVFKTGSWSLPSLAIELQMPQVPYFAMNTGVMVNRLSWSMQRSGNLTATVGLLAQGTSEAATSSAGTVADGDLLRFNHFGGAIKRNGSALASITQADVAYANNLDPVETIRSDGKIDGADPSIAALTGTLTTRFANTTLLDQAAAETSCSLEFGWTRPSGESLTVQVHRVFLPRPKVTVDGPQGVQANFDWQAALDSVEDCMATITLVNDASSYA